MINKRVWNAVLGCYIKNDRMISVHFQGKPFQHHSNSSPCPNHRCQRSWSWSLLWRHRRPPRTNTKNRCSIHHWGLECKSRNSRKPNRQVTGKFDLGIQNEAGQRLTEFCQENALVIANTLLQQHKRRLYTWTSPNGQYQNQTYYIPCSWRWRSCIQLAKTRPGADCGSDHQLFIAKFRLKWKKRGETTRTARQIRKPSSVINAKK